MVIIFFINHEYDHRDGNSKGATGPRTRAGDVRFAIMVMIVLTIIVMIMIIMMEVVKVQNRPPRTRAGDLARVNLVTRPVRQLE